MKSLSEFFEFTVPLGKEAHQLAEEFRQHQHNPQKGKQVYLNTLAVCAVEFYLRCLGIETKRTASESFDPVMQSLANVADLEVENLGKLECRPVLPNERIVRIPPEVWSDRIGYVAVQMTESLKEAMLIGFIEKVETEELALSDLRSLADFPAYISQLKQPRIIHLSHWLQGIFEVGWQAVEALLEPKQAELAFNFRGIDGIKHGGKLLQLEDAGEQVILSVGLNPTTESEMNILVEVHPAGEQTYLPHNLQLIVLNEQGEPVMEATAKGTKNIQFEFSGESGEQFSIKVALGDFSVTETFLI